MGALVGSLLLYVVVVSGDGDGRMRGSGWEDVDLDGGRMHEAVWCALVSG